MEDKTYIFVYETLRRFNSNYYHVELDKKSRYIYTCCLKKYQMYNFHDAPFIIAAEDEKLKIVGDLFELTDLSVLDSIREMEFCAGYVEKEVDIYEYKALTWVFDFVPDDATLNPTGIWRAK